MTRTALCGTALSALLLSLPAPAAEVAAGDCAAGDAPTTHDSATCDAGGDAVCAASEDTLRCSLGVNGESLSAEIWAVHDYAGSGTDLSFWGTDAGGDAFCCVVEDTASVISRVQIRGGAQGDDIRLGYGADAMAPHRNAQLTVEVLASAGDDDIEGAITTDALYAEHLYGESGDDTIDGKGGDDVLVGGVGDDTLYGGSGDDVLRGGPDDDVLNGGDDGDDIEGDDGSDSADGGGGDDACDAEAELDCES